MGLLESIEIESEIGDKIPDTIPEEFLRDPEPGERPTRGRGRPRKTAAAPAEPSKTQVTRLTKSVAADLAGLFDLGGTMWELAGDTCCAPVLQEQAKPMGDAIAACLARNPRLLAKLVDLEFVSLTVLIGALGKAVKPVVEAIYHNHIAGGGDNDDGPDGGNGFDASRYPAYSS